MSGVRPGVDTPSGGKYVYRAPVRHNCPLPIMGAHVGDVWRCDCSQAWKRKKNHKWVKVTWPEVKEK